VILSALLLRHLLLLQIFMRLSLLCWTLLWKSNFLVLVLMMLQLISTILLSYVRCRNIRM
jgi:hypothetical protein